MSYRLLCYALEWVRLERCDFRHSTTLRSYGGCCNETVKLIELRVRLSATSFPGSLFSASLIRWNRYPGCGWSCDHLSIQNRRVGGYSSTFCREDDKANGEHFHMLGTKGFHVKAEKERFIAVSSHCRQNVKSENFTSSFGRLRQRIAPKSVPHVQHDYVSLFNQSNH